MRTLFISILFLPLTNVAPTNATSVTICDVQGNPKKNANAKLAKAKVDLAKKLYEQGNYSKAYGYVKQALKLSPNNSEALQLKEQCEYELERIKQRATSEYNEAVASESAEALQQFINTYPTSNLAKQAQNRLQELKIWQQCKAQNTKEAYNAYLNQSQLKAYADDARQAINCIEEEERRVAHVQEAKAKYAVVSQSNSLEQAEQFAKDYADTEYAEKMKPYISLLKARKAFGQNNLSAAYTLYAQTVENMPEALTVTDKQQYFKAKEYSVYQDLKGSDDTDKLQQFLKTYGIQSPYYDSVSDRVALLKVNKLSAYTYTSSDLSEVRSYVQTESTRQQVQSVITRLETERSAYEKQQRTLARKRWWKNRVTLGWKIIGMDYMDEHFALTTGLRLRGGRYTDLVNFLVSCDFNYTMVSDPNYSGYSSNENDRFEGLACYVEPAFGLRFNMGKRSKSARFFVGVHAVKGYKISDVKEADKANHRKSTFAIMPEIGWSGRHFDFSIYYKYYLKGNTLYKSSNTLNTYYFGGKEISIPETVNENYGNNRVGLSVTWFF